MEAYAKALLWAIPGFLVLVLIEIGYGYFKKKQTYTLMDTLASLSSGITNIIKDSLGLAVVLISYPFLVKWLAITEIPVTIGLYLVAFICIDFASYWTHRLNHKINIFWNQHIIHHSSEEFNLACALRQSISNVISFNAVFLIPAAFLGIAPEVINVLAPLHLFGQFWYHTRHIGKLGFLEYILVTPSQHRVHHAINPLYIDKNLAAIFSVWDRLFGTFQEELDSEPPVYGTLKPVRTWNPIVINFMHFWGLVQDAWYTNSIQDKFKLWFMPTGWRPKDVSERFPRAITTEVNQQVKYKPEYSVFSKIWILFQFVGINIFLFLLLFNFEALSSIQLLMIGMLILLNIFGYSAIMDQYRWGIGFKLFVDITGLVMLTSSPIGFEFAKTVPVFHSITLLFFGLSLLSQFFFYKQIKSP